MKKLFGLVMVFMFAAVMSHALVTLENEGGTAKAKIIQAATLTHANGGLDFGTIIRGTNGGKVVVPAVDNPTAGGDIGGRTSGSVSADHFVLDNLEIDVTYSVTVPESITIENANHDTMSVDLTVSAPSVTNVPIKNIYVGGTLTVGPDQAVGEYKGYYTVTVTY